jgi:2,3-bisphosphoglycerate-independent phosphoglycerate mutase
MISQEQLGELSVVSETKIVLLVMDGLGGLPDPKTGKTELETARIPNLDNLARESICGLCEPVSPGITPGSGPGHLALFGYEPLKWEIGRGVLEALGVDFDLHKDDIAARGNFCTVDGKGLITDRRAGRITTEKCQELCTILNKIKVEGVKIFVTPVREHRFLFVLRGNSLSPDIFDTDPQKTGELPLEAKPKKQKSSLDRHTADLINSFVSKASKVLSNQHPANMILLRGFSKMPNIPTMSEIYKLNPAAIATYPMYRGLSKLVGMKVVAAPVDITESVQVLKNNFSDYDYFFIHFKETDSSGEDGNFERKVKAIEKVDKVIPQILDIKPDVFIITGDHSTPATLKAHSWHPLPIMIFSKWCRRDAVAKFTESACLSGGLGIFSSVNIMPLAMANALKLTKFGA